MEPNEQTIFEKKTKFKIFHLFISFVSMLRTINISQIMKLGHTETKPSFSDLSFKQYILHFLMNVLD